MVVILIVLYFISYTMFMYSYCMFMYGYPDWGFSVTFLQL